MERMACQEGKGLQRGKAVEKAKAKGRGRERGRKKEKEKERKRKPNLKEARKRSKRRKAKAILNPQREVGVQGLIRRFVLFDLW